MINALVGRLRRALARDRGAALAEYAMLLALVAMVLVATMSKLSGALESKVDKVVSEIKKMK